MQQKIIVYLPVIHQGYLKLFEKYPNADILIINQDLIKLIDSEFDYLRKEIRSITPQQAEITLEALLPKREISLIGANDISIFNSQEQEIILPKEDIFIWLAEKHLSNAKVSFDTTFLRWNRNNSTKKQDLVTKNTVSESDFSKEILTKSENKTELSSDWWRQVSAVVFDENSKIVASSNNHHIPTPYTPYIDSDPRNAAHKGESIEISTAIHAESKVIAECAKKGLSLQDTNMFVSTFPCPVCAKLIANSGIKTLYFQDGYAMVDGKKVLTDTGIKIIKII
jgi:dCMP deaminase